MYKICWCSLAGTAACARCNNNPQYGEWSYYHTYPNIPIRRFCTKKITEKFDENGKLIERIIEEPIEEGKEWYTINNTPCAISSTISQVKDI